MDPKNSNQPLDPKLQQIYDKVMGTDLATPQAAPSAPTPMPADPIPSVSIDQPIPTPPSIPTSPMPSAMPQPTQPPAPSVVAPTTPLPPVPQPQPETNSMDPLHATIAVPQIAHHDTETVTIGMGGNPIAAAAQKKKGISPVIIIFGSIVFLVVYAFFWIRFFGYKIPFLP